MDSLSFLLELILNTEQAVKELVQIFGGWIYFIFFLIVFSETGLVFTPFLPGDSLLLATGILAAGDLLNVWLLFVIFSVAAILGDTVNYWIGHFLGEKLFNKKIPFLKREYLEKANKFYEKHGAKTIILARFLPIIRTFAPFVAGIAKMDYQKFAIYNVTGGIFWAGLFVFVGYLFGNIPAIKENLSLVIIAIIIISLLPAGFGVLKHCLKKRKNQMRRKAFGKK